jgi:hypothetical protein
VPTSQKQLYTVEEDIDLGCRTEHVFMLSLPLQYELSEDKDCAMFGIMCPGVSMVPLTKEALISRLKALLPVIA